MEQIEDSQWRKLNEDDLPSDRHFGLVVGGALWVGAFLFRQAEVIAALSSLMGLILVSTGFFRPAILRPLNKFWMRIGLFLSRFTNPVLVGFMYCAVLTPWAIVLRLMKGKFLETKLDPSADSYWVNRKAKSISVASLKRQF